MKKYFITGLVILLPLVITIAIAVFLVNFFTKPFIGFVSKFLDKITGLDHGFFIFSHDQIVNYSSRFLILLLLFLITVGLGYLTRWFLLHAIVRLTDTVLKKIPVVSSVYKTSQDLIKTLFVSDKKSFQQVVMVPFPRPGVYVMGLVARESPEICSKKTQKDLVSVLVPTTPNPTTGFLMMFDKSELIYLDLKPEDAIKYIVSCGVIIPSEKVEKEKNAPSF